MLILTGTVEILLLAAALVLFVPVVMLWVECIAALWGAPQQEIRLETLPHVAILIPAHNEALGIAGMLQTLLPHLAPQMRALVIADNCTDATAEIARRMGVTVLERREPTRVGKSYALAFGVEALRADPPAVVIVLDADCVASAGTLRHLAQLAYTTKRPVQAVYLLDAPPQAHPTQMLAAFAFRVKNRVRPIGLSRLGLPCLLTGSGMALPWNVVCAVPLGSGKLAEDLWLTVELVSHNHLPLLDADAHVHGQMPSSAKGATAQHRRWEHGHLETILHGAPRLVAAAWKQKRLAPLGLMLELLVPPLSLLAVMAGMVGVFSLAAFGLGFSGAPAALCAVNGILLVCSITAAWWNYGRGDLSPGTVGMVPLYILSKLPLYLAFVLGRKTLWERSEREAGTLHAESISHDDRT